MSDSLLLYYNQELTALRSLAADFALAHPKIAARLRLSADTADDPHVERLLEGVAFLGARVQQRLDDEFPELTEALLGVLYPHYLAPFPSCAIVQLEGQADLDRAVRLPAGLPLATEPVRGESCRFQTAWPHSLWPVQVEAVRLSGLPLAAPPNPCAAGAVSVLRITLRCTGDSDFTALQPDRLRFFLRAGPTVSLPLMELLAAHGVSVAYADGPTDPRPVIVAASAIEPAGFAAEDALLPWPARSFSGFRLLTEYFAFPEKFLFVDFTGLESKTLLQAGKTLDIFVYLNRAVPELERMVGADSMALNCVPIVNLFSQRCEPIALTHTDTEYRVVPDVRRQTTMEVWQIERVRETQADGTTHAWQPFYRLAGMSSDGTAKVGGSYVPIRRAPAAGGAEIYLGVCDTAFDVDHPADSVLSVDALCFNRDLPASLPFGGNHPSMELIEGNAAIRRVTCLTAPTPTLRLPPGRENLWRLISHLSLGHLSVVGGADAATALKEVLRLYDRRDTPETRAAIEALVSVSAQPGAARVPGARVGAFCRGLDVTLGFDARAWETGGLFLLASVLERFLALHATVNAFVRSRAVVQGRLAAAWPARAGAQVLL